jgi:hypothetical protein
VPPPKLRRRDVGGDPAQAKADGLVKKQRNQMVDRIPRSRDPKATWEGGRSDPKLKTGDEEAIF